MPRAPCRPPMDIDLFLSFVRVYCSLIAVRPDLVGLFVCCVTAHLFVRPFIPLPYSIPYLPLLVYATPFTPTPTSPSSSLFAFVRSFLFLLDPYIELHHYPPPSIHASSFRQPYHYHAPVNVTLPTLFYPSYYPPTALDLLLPYLASPTD